MTIVEDIQRFDCSYQRLKDWIDQTFDP